jgi:hypothetical protein
MTIYSQHTNCGKVQILATYKGDAGVASSTMTSVDDATAAAAIVDALNRISASAYVADPVPKALPAQRVGKQGRKHYPHPPC